MSANDTSPEEDLVSVRVTINVQSMPSGDVMILRQYLQQMLSDYEGASLDVRIGQPNTPRAIVTRSLNRLPRG